MDRGVAQFGSALALGARGRWFESSRPDHKYSAPVAQGIEQRTSNPWAVGSIPTRRARVRLIDGGCSSVG